MSDAPQGPGWWQASDRRWYPPETHPTQQPPPYRPRPPKSKLTPRDQRIMAVLVILGVVALVVYLAVGSRDTEAEIMCERFVKERLASPSSASFEHTITRDNGGGRWTVAGEVDSDNRFGASLRSSYRCEMRDDGGQWRLLDIGIE